MMVATVSLMVGALATTALCTSSASPVLGLGAGILVTLLFYAPPAIIVGMLVPGGVAYSTATLGAGAGTLLGVGLVLFFLKRLPMWGHVAVIGVLAAAGTAWGWCSVYDLTGVRVGVGSLFYGDPWTPQGDAFLMIVPGEPDADREASNVCWYSSDLGEKHTFTLPPRARLLAVGQEAALIVSRSDSDDKLWWVPRDAEPRVISEAPGFAKAILSPNRCCVLIRAMDNECKIVSWQLCEIDEGGLTNLHPPVPTDSVSVIGLNNDGTLLWLKGSRPLDKGKNVVTHATPLPDSGAFPYPGERYTAWTWKGNSQEAPVQVYAAATQWLGWRAGEEYGQVLVCRVSESKPAQVEYVRLDIGQARPEATAITKNKFEQLPLPTQSPDGRFIVFTPEGSFLGPLFVKDRRTSRRWRVPYAGLLPVVTGPRWSPSAHSFLIETMGIRFRPALWRWRQDAGDTVEQQSVVYLVDMARN